MPSLITFENVSYRYPMMEGSGWALRDLSLSVDAGELVGIVGPNGAGKSSLCLTLNGLIPNFFRGELTGEVLVDGQSTRDTPPAQLISRVGVLFQNPFEQLTGVTESVTEEVAFGPENLGLPREEILRRTERAMDAAGIEHLADRHPFALSGGQQQRVALAAVLAMEPSILVLDEPTSQLDPVGVDEVFEVVHRMHRAGYTILMAEHKIDALAEIATRVIVLADGKVVMDDSPRTVLTDRGLSRFNIRPPRVTALAQELGDRGVGPIPEEPLTFREASVMLRKVVADARG
jgi:energy-coupling factor transporter ATP-binding protein EcfA2